MQSVNNQNILGYCCNALGDVVGSATFSYNAGTNTLTVTDTSTIAAPDTFKIMHVDVYDRFGGKVYGHIDVAAGNVALSTATLNASRGFAVNITLVTTAGVAKDGSAYKIANSQTTGGFDVEK